MKTIVTLLILLPSFQSAPMPKNTRYPTVPKPVSAKGVYLTYSIRRTAPCLLLEVVLAFGYMIPTPMPKSVCWRGIRVG